MTLYTKIPFDSTFDLVKKNFIRGALPEPYVSRMIPFNPGIPVTASITSGLMPGNIFNIAIFVSTSQNALTSSVRGCNRLHCNRNEYVSRCLPMPDS